MKTCFQCNKSLPLDCFYKNSNMADGYLGKCKECKKDDVHSYRLKNLERIREYEKTEKRRLVHKNFHKVWRKKSTKHADTIRRNNELYPEKYKARYQLRNAVRCKKIIKPSHCEKCPNTLVHGHHHDYSKPFDVKWLCPIHHAEEHRGL